MNTTYDVYIKSCKYICVIYHAPFRIEIYITFLNRVPEFDNTPTPTHKGKMVKTLDFPFLTTTHQKFQTKSMAEEISNFTTLCIDDRAYKVDSAIKRIWIH